MGLRLFKCSVSAVFGGALLVVVGLTSQVFALDLRDQDEEAKEALKARQDGETMPYKKLKARVESLLKARVIGQRLRHTNEGLVYELRLKNKFGVVIFAVVNAKTGKIIQKRGG